MASVPEVDDGFAVRWTLSLLGIKRFQFDGSFNIYAFFLPPGDTTTAEDIASQPSFRDFRMQSPFYAGSAGVFTLSNAAARGCANCQRRDDTISANIDATQALAAAGIVSPDTDKDAQLPNWRDSLRLLAVSKDGKLQTRVDLQAVQLNAIENGGPRGLRFFNADDAPGIATE
jgi:hypothetical protein